MSIGRMEQFKIHEDDWNLYIDRLEQYFIVNSIDEKMHVPTLITVIGSEGYELLVNLCTPKEPKTLSFSELKVVMQKHLQPKPSILAERYKFRHRKQNSGETVADYIAVLKRMSKSCEFGAWLEDSLRDQLVCGITSDVIRQRLFSEDTLDFTKAYRLASGMEAAEKDAAVVNDRAIVSVAKFDVHSTIKQSATRMWQHSGNNGSRPAVSNSGRGARGGQGASAQPNAGAGPRASRATAQQQGYRQQPCSACGGGGHDSATCKFARYVCRVCNRQGHLRRMCPYMAEHHSVTVMAGGPGGGGGDSSELDDADSDEVIVNINQLSISQCKPILITLDVQGKQLVMECDTGSAISCVSQEMYEKLFKNLPIKPCKLMLRYYTGELVRPVGVIRPLVKYKKRKQYLDLYIIENGKTVLLGRQWIAGLRIEIPTYESSDINSVECKQSFNLSEFSSRYCDVFADGLGRFTGGKVRIHLREGARPVFMRARPLAYALREPVERALDQLVRDGVLTPVDRSDWATPIVPVVKKDGNIRICADYKITLNKVLEVDRYPLPKVEDLLVRLNGGERFSKIDLSQAYSQFELDDTRKYTVINTHKGLFMYNRLVFGLSSSPGIFQKHLEQLFADMPQVGVFIDDVIITGMDDKEHLANLNKVFDRLQSVGLRVQKEKCKFFAESVNYLGHVISKRGVHTCPDKIKAISEAPAPTNVSELRSFIGMVMYYSKFVKNTSTILAPLYELLKTGIKFVWSVECELAFTKIKELLSGSTVLAHYSPERPLVLTVDASSVGIGAVLSHLTPAGDRPVAYASRTLSSAERAYSQIDKEALAIVYGVRKYHQYLYGRKFLLRTDHKPLTHIFGSKSGIPVMAASRVQRWAVLLSGYNYDIEYVTSKNNCADALSRLPQAGRTSEGAGEVSYIHFVEDFLPITNREVKIATAKDAVLSKVVLYLQSGWTSECMSDDQLKSYYNRRNELYLENGCIMWGYRMVIPPLLQRQILKQLHSGHMGIVKTKSIARSYVYWPNIDADVELMCRQCQTCAAEAPAPTKAPPKPWPYISRPWTRVHVDFMSLNQGKTFLVLIDASTKWLEVQEMSRTNASSVIKVLRSIFARFGLPVQLVSDQGPPFTSTEFKEFLEKNGIYQMFSPTYHPASNGAAENAVKLCKRAIKKAVRDRVDIDTALQTYLLAYRNTEQSTTGESPAMLLQRRTLRSRLDLLRNDRTVEERVRGAQDRQVKYAGGVQREFQEGETVWSRTYSGPDKWLKGTIRKRDSSRSYIIDNGDGLPITKHIDQLRRRSVLAHTPSSPGHTGNEVLAGSEERENVIPAQRVVSDVRLPINETEQKNEQTNEQREVVVVESPHPTPPPQGPPPLMNRFQRSRKGVSRYGFEID